MYLESIQREPILGFPAWAALDAFAGETTAVLVDDGPRHGSGFILDKPDEQFTARRIELGFGQRGFGAELSGEPGVEIEGHFHG